MNHQSESSVQNPLSILIVDDEEMVLEVTRKYLIEEYGFKVDTALSAKDAFSKVKTGTYDAIIADYEMEGMSGIDLLKCIRDSGYDTPFIVFTGKGREEVVIEAFENGADGYVQIGGEVRSQFAELTHKVRTSVQKRHEERKLLDTRRLLDNAHRLAQFGVWTWEQEKDKTTWSDEINQIFGWKKDRPVPSYSEYSAWFTGQGGETLAEAGRQALLSHTPFDLELELIIPEGKRVWVRIMGEPTYSPDGIVTGLQGTMQDITASKRTQEALYLKSYAIRSSMNAIALADLSGTLTYVNPAFLSIWGYSHEEEVLGREAVSFWKDPVEAEQVIASLKENGRWIGEMQAVRADGSQAILYVSAHYILDPEDCPLALMASFIDITHNKHAEQELLSKTRLIEGMLNGIQDIVGLQLPDHTVIRYNQAGYDFLGKEQADIQGKKCYELIGRKSQCEPCATSLAIKDHKITRIEKFIPELSVYLECTSNPIISESGEVELVVEMLHDITERKKAERALNEVNRKLHLLSSITRHDILNSLGGVLISLDSVPKEELPLEVKGSMDRIEEFALRIKKQIEFTHDYQELGVKQATWQRLEDLFTETSSQVEHGLVRITHSLDNLRVFADPLLQKAIYNIVDNAFRYGGPALKEIRSYYQISGNFLIWIIEDDGRGIDDGIKEQIFERGYGSNTGFGLFFVREILSITGITIKETGEPGRGARFLIVVPENAYLMGDPEITAECRV